MPVTRKARINENYRVEWKFNKKNKILKRHDVEEDLASTLLRHTNNIYAEFQCR